VGAGWSTKGEGLGAELTVGWSIRKVLMGRRRPVPRVSSGRFTRALVVCLVSVRWS
jgi:hypothetical protein